MNTSYHSKITVHSALPDNVIIDANDLNASDDTFTLIEIFNNLSFENIKCIESISIQKYVKKSNKRWAEYTGTIQFELIDNKFVETEKDNSIPTLKRHIKIIEEINQIIASKQEAIIQKKEESQQKNKQDVKDFYDFASYRITEGLVDLDLGMFNTIKSLINDYVDGCKNSDYSLDPTFCDDVDFWHVADIIKSHLSLEVGYYKARLDKARKAIKTLMDI